MGSLRSHACPNLIRRMESYIMVGGTVVLGLVGLVIFFFNQGPAPAKKRSDGGSMKPRGASALTHG